MRNTQQMMAVILGFARADARVRAVIMNGSRANPAAPADIFQDYDIVYLVHELESFTRDHTWLELFGERMIMQMPELLRDPANDGHFGYLMQFADGNRIDLTLAPLSKASNYTAQGDSESILLLDKDGRLPPFLPPSDRDYHIKPPTALDWESCTNNFWWVMCYVAKGLWRRELPYALHVYNSHVRDAFEEMLGWYIGVTQGFAQSTGKCNKYFERLLSPAHWTLYKKTWCGAEYEAVWDAVDAMCALFSEVAPAVGAHFGYTYPTEDARRVCAHLHHVRALPADAKEIYP